MEKPPLDPDCAALAPSDEALTPYDLAHLITYLRLLDAERDQADWLEAAKLVLHLDPLADPVAARRSWESHLARAHWMSEHGYRHLLARE